MIQNPYLLTESPEGKEGRRSTRAKFQNPSGRIATNVRYYTGYKMIYIRTINSHAGYLGFKMGEEPEAQHASYGTASRVRLPEGDFRYVSTTD